MKVRRKESRREFTMVAAAAIFGSTCSPIMAAPPPQATPRLLNAEQALRELLDGNQRFVTGKRLTPRGRPEDFRALTHGQFPEAVIIACGDSRVAPEILFDVGVGDIFVVRVAGNIV